MAAMVLAMGATDTARGLLMPMPTMVPATAMAAMVLAMVATDTARGLLMPMPTMVLATAMAADTARGPLMPTTAAATAMAVTAMAVTAMAVTATASKPQTSKSAIASLHQNCHLKISSITRRPGKLMAVCLSTINQTTNEEFRYIHTAL